MLNRARREIDGIAEDLFAPLLAPRSSTSAWRIVGWDCEQGLQIALARGENVVLVELEPRDEARDCFARTRLFNVCARRAFKAATPLGPDDRRLVDLVVSVVRAREGRLPAFEPCASARSSLVREIEVPRLLIPEGERHYYVNPYVGCTIGCEFCYVAPRADMSRRLEGLPSLEWGRYVDVKINAVDVLRREVREHPRGIVRFSPILTDPYQPLERRYRITRQCLEVLLEAGFAPVILTRAARVTEDLELLRRFPAAAVGFSIPTDDDRIRQKFEPGADPIPVRIEALARCRAAGLRTFAAVQPMLPMDPERLATQLAPHIDAVRVDRLYPSRSLRHLYEAAGMPEAAEDSFFVRMEAALRAAFAAKGVRYDELDGLDGLLGF